MSLISSCFLVYKISFSSCGLFLILILFSEMFKIMDSLQREYLELVGQQSRNKELFFKDLDLVLSVDSDPVMRKAAEERIRQEVLGAGEMICHGDYLTNIRFETCKRLKQGSITAIERYDFMKLFRLGLFHLRMTKTIQVNNKTKVKSVQLGKTLSFVKFVVEWGGVEGSRHSRRPRFGM